MPWTDPFERLPFHRDDSYPDRLGAWRVLPCEPARGFFLRRSREQHQQIDDIGNTSRNVRRRPRQRDINKGLRVLIGELCRAKRWHLFSDEINSLRVRKSRAKKRGARASCDDAGPQHDDAGRRDPQFAVARHRLVGTGRDRSRVRNAGGFRIQASAAQTKTAARISARCAARSPATSTAHDEPLLAHAETDQAHGPRAAWKRESFGRAQWGTVAPPMVLTLTSSALVSKP